MGETHDKILAHFHCLPDNISLKYIMDLKNLHKKQRTDAQGPKKCYHGPLIIVLIYQHYYDYYHHRKIQVNSPCDEKSPLQLAVHGGFMDVTKFLIAAGADLDMTDEDGDTALMFAIYG